MAFYDIFNGDADGLCARHQLRLQEPRAVTLVSGVKRDIQLLRLVRPDRGDQLTILDMSLDSNRPDLQRVLEAGANCVWIDHHYAGELIEHPALHCVIDVSADVCTSLIVDRWYSGCIAYRFEPFTHDYR
mgnify:CR=1 FL=1